MEYKVRYGRAHKRERSSTATLLIASREKNAAEEAELDLRGNGIKADTQPLTLGRDLWQARFLVNNAGIAGAPSPEIGEARSNFNRILNTNVTSVAVVTSLLLPLLQKSSDPRVINVSSGRTSLTRVTSGVNPPTKQIPYLVSKAALNLLTIEMGHSQPDVLFQVASPGHCKTALNGFRGARDPAIGAVSVAELALADRKKFPSSFWDIDEGDIRQVPR